MHKAEHNTATIVNPVQGDPKRHSRFVVLFINSNLFVLQDIYIFGSPFLLQWLIWIALQRVLGTT